MITTAIALLIGIQGPQQDSKDTSPKGAAEILSKMFAHYADAKSVSGTIRMTQTATSEKGQATVHINSQLQFDRPALIYLHQVRDGSRPDQWFLTSDGKEFSYNPPENRDKRIYGKKRMVELVAQHNVSQTLSDFLSAATFSLGDINPIIISAIGSKTWLKKLTGQWATLIYGGRMTVNGSSVYTIRGQYRENPNMGISGEFEASIGENGDFVRYELRERMMFPGASKQEVDVTTVWDSTLKVGADTDRNLYRVIF